jgi:hypothetical protein
LFLVMDFHGASMSSPFGMLLGLISVISQIPDLSYSRIYGLILRLDS